MAYVEKIKLAGGKTRYKATYRDPAGRERSKTFDRKLDADNFVTTIESSKLRGEWVDPKLGKRTVDDWAAEYRATTAHLRPSTKARDESYYRTHVKPTFGAMPLAAVGHLDVRTWVAELSSRRAPATVQKAHQTLSKIMQAAVDAGLITRNPCDRVALPRVERDEMRFLTPDEIVRLADTIDPRYRALVIFDAYCGLRIAELAGLRRDRLDLLRRQVRVVEIAVEVRGDLFVGPPKTNAGRRTVPVPGFAAAELEQHLADYASTAPDALVFPGRDGGVLRANAWRRRFWIEACDAAGLGTLEKKRNSSGKVVGTHYEGLRPHDLRHTAVSLWIAAGATPKQVAVWAGHTSVSVVLDRYGHLFPGNEDPVVARLEAIAAAAGSPAIGQVVELSAAGPAARRANSA